VSLLDLPVVLPDSLSAGLVQGLESNSLLGAFNLAGVLAAADVHVALRLGRLGGEADELVTLAAAFAVRAPRVGHVRVDLSTVRETAAAEISDEIDVTALPWPAPTEWLQAVETSPLVAVGEQAPSKPLRLVGSALYLDRYWRDELAVAADLTARAQLRAMPGALAAQGLTSSVVVTPALVAALTEVFPGEAGEGERQAALAAVTGGLTVIAGGPGTGKTTTVARTIGLLMSEAAAGGREPPLVALTAPTGKAAARMGEALREHDLDSQATTIHRLLGRLPNSSSRFRHDRNNRLPHDVVVVDETSMVALGLMARLLEAIRPEARLIVVGDPEQLASVEAGAVLADIVGPSEQASGPLAGSVVVLRTNHRFGGVLADLAGAVRRGDPDEVMEVITSADETVRWIDADVATANEDGLEPLRALVASSGSAIFEAALAGDGPRALQALGAFRLLCAHRRGPAGVAVWNPVVEKWLRDAVEGFSGGEGWYTGRPVLLTANDYGLRLYNGDAGVMTAATDDSERGGVAFHREGSVATISPTRLSRAETAWAITVHKSQGSEFDGVGLLLPDVESRILTRELLYTAITRARRQLVIVGSEASLRAAVMRRVARASGLAERLWTV
jgi:exodeoxyribonuclease V alpha subunit